MEGFEGNAELKKESMILSAPGFPALTVYYRSITSFTAADYKVFLAAGPASFLKLYDLGFEYENFLKHFSDLRNEVLIKDLLMKEKLTKPDVEGEFEYSDKDGNIKEKGQCRVRAYETGLVLIPLLSQIKRFPFGLIDSFESKDYRLAVKLENQDRLTLSMLGDQLDPLTRQLSKSFNLLISKSQDLIKEISPQENDDSLRESSFLLKDGKAAMESDVKKNSKKLWDSIEEKIKSEDMQQYYEFLKINSDQSKTCAGIKKGLFGSVTGYYIWFLFPLYNGNSKNYANAVAMEAMTLRAPSDSGSTVSSASPETLEGGNDFGETTDGSDARGATETGGRATYVFRIIDRPRYASEYKKSAGKPSARLNDLMESEYSGFIRKINSCMLAINFRREPVYFTDEQLKDDKNISYRYAVAMIPELAWLRDNFVGRIIHKNITEWQKDFKELIEFNLNSSDNSVKFKKRAGD